MSRHGDLGRGVGRIAVAIPVHNEAALIADCLRSLARQDHDEIFDVVVLLNNCSDGTELVVRRMAASLPYRLQVHEYWLEPSTVNAGVARRLAMQHAAGFVGDDGVLLTTDADACVPPDWIETNLREIAAGADAVAGMSRMDAADEAKLPPHLGEDEARVMVFAGLLDEIDWLLDPNPNDKWPRHTENSGASLAVRASWHERVDGIPAVASGEDRAFIRALQREDAKIRHARDVVVTVSGRLTGRAAGGMADTMARRMQKADLWLDEGLESAPRRARRAQLRASVARARSKGLARDLVTELASALRVPTGFVERALVAPTFGAGWMDLERVSPALMRVPLPMADLDAETEQARRTLRSLRAETRVSVRAYPADTAPHGFDHGGSSPAALLE